MRAPAIKTERGCYTEKDKGKVIDPEVNKKENDNWNPVGNTAWMRIQEDFQDFSKIFLIEQ